MAVVETHGENYRHGLASDKADSQQESVSIASIMGSSSEVQLLPDGDRSPLGQRQRMLSAMVKDKYRNFAELAVGESSSSYHIVTIPRGTSVVIAAPHAGAIEPGTSEIARAIAGAELSLYLFEGRRDHDNRDLHLTSINFDEPRGMRLVSEAEMVVAVHGGASEHRSAVYLGGRNEAVRKTLSESLVASGFDVGEHAEVGLQGNHPDNICNRGRSGAGVQLEVSRALRLELFPSLLAKGRAAPRRRFHEFVRAVRHGLGLKNVN